MNVLHERCAALDIGKKDLKARVRRSVLRNCLACPAEARPRLGGSGLGVLEGQDAHCEGCS
jgi:hypothetical protein